MVLNRACLQQCRSLAVHAGVVDLGGRAVAFPGVSGAGKSTLTAALVQAGAQYRSDEALALTLAGARLYSKPVTLTAWSLRRLGLRGVPDGLQERPVAPDELGRTGPPIVPLGTVVRMERTPGPAALTAAQRGSAAVDLLAHAFNHYRDPQGAVEVVERSRPHCGGRDPDLRRPGVRRGAAGARARLTRGVVDRTGATGRRSAPTGCGRDDSGSQGCRRTSGQARDRAAREGQQCRHAAALLPGGRGTTAPCGSGGCDGGRDVPGDGGTEDVGTRVCRRGGPAGCRTRAAAASGAGTPRAVAGHPVAGHPAAVDRCSAVDRSPTVDRAGAVAEDGVAPTTPDGPGAGETAGNLCRRRRHAEDGDDRRRPRGAAQDDGGPQDLPPRRARSLGCCRSCVRLSLHGRPRPRSVPKSRHVPWIPRLGAAATGGARSAAGRRGPRGPAAASTAGTAGVRRRRPAAPGRRRRGRRQR